MPGAYLALVVAMLVYVEVGSRLGDIGFFGIWPILATAPVSLLLLSFFGPAAAALDSAPIPPGDPYYGSEPPAEPPTEFIPESAPLPADWVPDTSVAADPGIWAGLGFHAAVLVSALVNAAAIWSLLRYTARRRGTRAAQV
ncbi:SCO4225 family membrane protein [Streptomyces sp. NPDC057271]|uniref:SCO4225 family membrane protein n=1 Tax=unclassified Streptomyces TaxID=2593676 RepID=UPI00364051BB